MVLTSHFAHTHTRGPLANKTAKPPNWVSGGDLMGTDFALELVDQLAEAGVRSVTWTGGGEPTLHRDFDIIVQHGAGRIAQGVYTHGGHVNPIRAAVLKQACTFVYVSLDAVDADFYRRAKGVDRFDKACDGIRHLVAASGDATVGIGYLVTADNWRQIPDAVTLCRDLGADYVQFRPTILYDQEKPDVPDDDREWLDAAVRLLGWVANESNVIADIGRFEMYRDWDGHNYETCFWSGLQTVVTPNGKVWTCVNKREHAGAEIGDLTVESFAAVWARHKLAKVTGDCRVMCRGHLANLALDEVMRPREHADFV